MLDERAVEPGGSKSVQGKVHFSFLGRQGSGRVARGGVPLSLAL